MAATWPAHRDSAAVRQWATDLFDRAHRTGPIPDLGSPAWCELADRDPRKPAAAVRAALAWLHESDPEVIAARLRDELDQIDRAIADRIKATANDLSAAANWSRIAFAPTHTELARRRAHYPTPPRTPEEIRAAARQSWARFDTTDTSKEVAA